MRVGSNKCDLCPISRERLGHRQVQREDLVNSQKKWPSIRREVSEETNPLQTLILDF